MNAKQSLNGLLTLINTLQPKCIQATERIGSGGGVAMGIKSEFGASQGAPGALFGDSEAFQWRASGITLGFRCFTDQRQDFTSSCLYIPGLIL